MFSLFPFLLIVSSIFPAFWTRHWRCEARPGLKSFSKNLQSSIQTWIEEVFLRIFNLQSRPGLKKFFWESSIFNPDLDWRSFSENLQSSIFNPDLDWRSFSENLQSSIQTWIEEVFLRIFNLQSRPGLKKFFWESSIFNPDLDWRSFSENLQSSIFNPIHFAINCKPCLLVRTGCHLVHVYMYMYM